MTKKTIYRKAYAERAINISLTCKKATNKMIATALGVSETTIRNWRTEHAEFDKAITNARQIVREQVNKVVRGNLTTRKRKVVAVGGKYGTITTTEDVLPTYNDILVFNKMGGRGSIYDEHTDDQRDILRKIMARKVAGELSPVDAAQLLEAESITAPASLLLEVQRILGVKDNGDDKPTELTPAQRKARIAELQEKHSGRIKPADNAG